VPRSIARDDHWLFPTLGELVGGHVHDRIVDLDPSVVVAVSANAIDHLDRETWASDRDASTGSRRLIELEQQCLYARVAMVPRERPWIGPLLTATLAFAFAPLMRPSLGEELRSPWWLLGNYGFFVLFLGIGVAAHELGHAGAALAAGLRVYGMVIGGGPELLSFGTGRCRVSLRVVPGSGLTLLSTPHASWLRIRLMAVYLGGPLASAVILVVARVAMGDQAFFEHLFPEVVRTQPTPLGMFLFANAYILFVTLFPFPSTKRDPAALCGSDGYQFLTALTISPDRVRVLTEGCEALEAIHLCFHDEFAAALTLAERYLEHKPSDPVRRLFVASLHLCNENVVQGRVQLLELLPSAEPKLLPYVQSDIAWADILLNDPELLDEAERYSASAFKEMPRNTSIRGTRGAVLAVMGRADEAVPHLKHALAHATGRTMRAYNLCFLSIAESTRANVARGRAYADAAHREHPACVLLPRARAVLDATRA
jgi:hypothetical protein